MSRLSEREIARRLAEREEFEPPAGLLEKIKNEIPPEVSVGTEVPGSERRNPMPVRQRWLIAASLVATVGAGLLGFQVWNRQSASLGQASEEAPASQGEESRAVAREVGAEPEQDRAEISEATANPAPPASLAVPPLPPAAAKPAPEAAAKLRSLGYVTDQEAVQPVEVGVEGGVVGGVVGGVAGGVPGGVAGGVIGTYNAPLRVSRAMMDGEEGKPYDDVRFKSAGTNPFVETGTDRLSTFGLDVDTASYTVARRYLSDGNLPEPASVRVEEWVNYFDYGDLPPTRGDFAIRAEGAPSPFSPERRLLRFNIRARQVKAENRRPAVLTFVVDVSGSMDEENRLGLVKKSLNLLLDELRPTDQVGLVVYGSEARLLLEPSNDREVVKQAIERLVPEGSTNAEAGLQMGYDVAGRNFKMNSVNRIILCSDGVANVGHTGPQAILGRIGREARRGIELTTLGFGMGNYNDHLMEQLADKGDGRYAYIDGIDEAKRVLVEELTGTLQTIAKNAKVQVDFNPAAVSRYRLLGYENRAIADERFRDETVDAGEIGAGHSVTALYELEMKPGAGEGQTIATLHLRYRVPEIGNTTETVRKVTSADFAPTWEESSLSFRLASLVAQLAETLKGTSWARDTDLNDLARRVREVSQQVNPKSQTAGAKAAELADLAGKAARIRAGEGEE